jgi:hypothetical protein
MNDYTIHDHTCKFCGVAVNLKVHKNCPPTDIEIWKPSAACNPCADARRRMYQTLDQTTDLAAKWRSVRGTSAEDEMEPKIRLAFTMLTKAYCAACCVAFRQPNRWEPRMLNDLMSRPQNAYAILKDYEASFKPLIASTEEQQPEPPLPEMEFATEPEPF